MDFGETIAELVEVFQSLFSNEFCRDEFTVDISWTGGDEKAFSLLFCIDRVNRQESFWEGSTEPDDDRSEYLDRMAVAVELRRVGT